MATQVEVYKLIDQHYRKHASTTMQKLGGRFGNKHQAEDIVQEAYTRACQYWGSFNPEQSFDNWFTAILNNSIKDHFKSELLRGMTLTDNEEEEAVAPTVLERIEIKEISNIINKQPPNIARILDLALIKGYNATEIAHIVPENKANVRKIIQRFREELPRETTT